MQEDSLKEKYHRLHKLEEKLVGREKDTAPEETQDLDVSDTLQAEIDVLNETHHPLVQAFDAMADKIQNYNAENNKNTSDSISMYDEELVDSFRQLQLLNETVKDRLHHEQTMLQNLLAVKEEYEEILQLLLQFNQQEVEDNERRGDLDPKQEEEEEQLISQNEQLCDDLQYVGDCIKKQRQEMASTSTFLQANREGKAYCLLSDLLRILLDRCLDSPDDPYIQLDATTANPTDVQLLKDLFIISEYPDDPDLVCLVDAAAK